MVPALINVELAHLQHTEERRQAYLKLQGMFESFTKHYGDWPEYAKIKGQQTGMYTCSFKKSFRNRQRKKRSADMRYAIPTIPLILHLYLQSLFTCQA